MTTIYFEKNNARVTAWDKPEAENFRNALKGVLTTANIDSKTVQSAVKVLGMNYPKTLLAGGKSEDVIAVYETDGKTPVKLAQTIRGNLAQRILDSMTSAKRYVEIFTEKAEKTSSVNQVIPAEE